MDPGEFSEDQSLWKRLRSKMAVRTASGVELKSRAILWVVGGLALVIYCMYSWSIPTYLYKGKAKSLSSETWKTKPFTDIAPDVKKRIAKAVVIEMEVSFMMGDKRLKIFYRESMPWNKNEKAQIVVLLHGAGDSSEWWENIGTFQMLSSAGYHVFGLDLPGWGETKTHSVDDPAAFLGAFFHELGIEQPVLVPASMGGAYALPYMMLPQAGTCETRVAGFVPIAIVGTDKFKPATYHRCSVPTMIVYGTKDTKLGLHSVGDLRNLANNEIFPMEKAGHACVREKPDEWHKLLYNFLMQAAPPNKVT